MSPNVLIRGVTRVRHRRLLGVSLAAMLGSSVASTPAGAVPVTFFFTGTATLADGIWAGQGSAVSGFYTFDSDLETSDPLDGEIDRFRSSETPNLDLIFEFSVTVGAVTRTTASNAQPMGLNHHEIDWFDSAAIDRFRFLALTPSLGDDFVDFNLIDLTPVPPDAIAPGTGNLTGTPMLTAPDLSLFDTLVDGGRYESYDELGSLEGTLVFTPTSVTTVPEPTALLLLSAGVAWLGAWRRKRPGS